jgi:hypothetical protein
MPRPLTKEIEEFFGITEASLKAGEKPDWEFADGRNARAFILRLLAAARKAEK